MKINVYKMPRSKAVVRYNPRSLTRRSYNRALRAVVQSRVSRRLARAAARKAIQFGKKRIAKYVKNRTVKKAKTKNYVRIVGQAGGTTHTTTRMIVRRTPREQRFLRKLFANQPLKNLHIQRFGFSWMGASAASKTIWYSVTQLKFNNIHDKMQLRIISPTQNSGQVATAAGMTAGVANGPDAFIYIGKCTYHYELFNPTNYIITVYIYDLICKHDTPYPITYAENGNQASSAPENCMMKSTVANYPNNNGTSPTWMVADNTLETGTLWNTVGMKPTDYHIFNTLWKVKGLKKIILPPGSSHHHIVVYNPKVKVSKASLYYPRQTLTGLSKNGVAGITQSTLFGFEGQVCVEDNTTTDADNKVGTLPGKLVIKCIRKENIWNGEITSTNIISNTKLIDEWQHPKIFTDLIEQTPEGI